MKERGPALAGGVVVLDAISSVGGRTRSLRKEGLRNINCKNPQYLSSFGVIDGSAAADAAPRTHIYSGVVEDGEWSAGRTTSRLFDKDAARGPRPKSPEPPSRGSDQLCAPPKTNLGCQRRPGRGAARLPFGWIGS